MIFFLIVSTLFKFSYQRIHCEYIFPFNNVLLQHLWNISLHPLAAIFEKTAENVVRRHSELCGDFALQFPQISAQK